MRVRAIALFVWTLLVLSAPAHAQPGDPVAGALSGLEAALLTGTSDALRPLLDETADVAQIEDVASEVERPGLSRVVLRERDRQLLEGDA
ncbi:MAG: hypothetical protein ACLGHP_08125, partial [Vicinamibacteria bacterium]